MKINISRSVELLVIDYRGMTEVYVPWTRAGAAGPGRELWEAEGVAAAPEEVGEGRSPAHSKDPTGGQRSQGHEI